MRYYKLSMDMEREKDIILHCKNRERFESYSFKDGEYYHNENERIKLFFDEKEGDVWTDYLANDKGWFIVSEKLRLILQSLNSEIQFINIMISDSEGVALEEKYYIANIIKVVDALCLNKSNYFETYIEGKGTIYTVSKYGIYENKTEGADIFKLGNWQQVPIFVSENFKDAIEQNECTGMSFREIAVE
ncbi:Protein of unknown function [Butyrivibrio hungatei DSM 14810]|uniref:Immunity MXAN-0049 protein domain-containing protein n=1 Tax=Butyrivibrio hungatei DSM 14810 TaxID=1121132 RepID=A0A1M7RRS7_9FIRM|nr:DUF1629 domain-containing protein [Butyrivibrio hungatei]SHN49027.1 Protein of unknown function [Butyrivibrio hungatei DSM 14810]